MQNRPLIQTLILSVTLNVVLLALFFYFLVGGTPLHFAYRPKVHHHAEQPPLPADFFEKLPSVSWSHLLTLLEDTRKMEGGWDVRELALGALATFHDFDVERGLGKGELSKHIWEIKGHRFLMFPALSDRDFATLLHFANQEMWPLTPRGLFKQIQKTGIEASDPALIAFFCHTPDFVLLETLFARTYLPLQRRSILKLALEGGWQNLATFVKAQRVASDFSATVRQQLLVRAIDASSQTAAYLLLLTDAPFALYHLDDAHLMTLLDLLTVRTRESWQFVQTVAASLRLTPVRQKAISRIAAYTGKSPGEVALNFVAQDDSSG
jgi:hypothetical protein